MGHANIQNCVRNGVMCPMSRYLTLRAESQSPTARAVSSARSRKTGRRKTPHVGVIRYQTSIPTSRRNDTAKSTIPETAADTGAIRRGKYTFEMRLEFPTMLLPHRLSAPEKRFQGNNAV